MDQACTPEALAVRLLRFQALRAAAAAAGAPPGACAAAASGVRADCLAELAFDPQRPGPPRHLRDGKAAWHAAQQLGLEGAWTAEADWVNEAMREHAAAQRARGAKAAAALLSRGGPGAPASAAGAAAAVARRGALLLLQAGVVADAAAAGPWCGLAAEYHQRLAGLAEGEGEDPLQAAAAEEDSRPETLTPPPSAARVLEAMDRAAEAVGPGALLAAAPWFHADHLLGAGGAAGAAAAAAEGPADKECDWCGEEAPTGVQSSGGLECASCGCARYCSQGCAARAAPLHARNCWQLRLLSAKGVVLRARFDPERPAFDYGDDPRKQQRP
ncbi:hypothetical protein MNEG_5828 [Monoraphidium neglectum]|uniref:MYND-type domain-containing protein n=1 Tax=Monoraphidium neglectum TaxID=145388 RepID=A0A0D2MGA9_9CHLO|nr:hypothetical protein MNEG_5828 [Monoraphidium neglectum]KIZ02130.1 hypothetical protein MNEG_5828 [Monoraphidium neglectum]|eukprot:XP_013901149.1 hypothetical protein MNEG_5828 [Monoraphidium neglectum]